MKCTDVVEMLGVLIDGEIGDSDMKDIEDHFESCGSCAGEFRYLQVIRENLRSILPISAPALLDQKVMQAFRTFQQAKYVKKPEMEEQTRKTGWFGIPRFALAAALLVFAFTAVAAFQLGRFSAAQVTASVQGEPGSSLAPVGNGAENTPVRIVEIPVVREKIVKVPVAKEKIVTRTIYVERNKERVAPRGDDFDLKSSVENNNYLTKINLKDFQPVSEPRIRIDREVEKDEK